MNNFLKEKTISISILNLNMIDLESFLIKLNEVRNDLEYDNIVIHFDVMDGKFVPNKGVNLDLITIVKKYNFLVDVHLMCSNPKEYIDKAILLGADNITIHYEIEKLYENLKYLNELKEKLREKNKNLTIGISIKPETDIEKIFNYINMCDVILLMSVNPGLGGQTYLDDINRKIKAATDMKKIIQIDGGINELTIIKPNSLGVNSFVVGSYITNNINEVKEKMTAIENIIK